MWDNAARLVLGLVTVCGPHHNRHSHQEPGVYLRSDLYYGNSKLDSVIKLFPHLEAFISLSLFL